jgi:hypothetical protein
MIRNIYCKSGLTYSIKLSAAPPGWKELIGGTVPEVSLRSTSGYFL